MRLGLIILGVIGVFVLAALKIPTVTTVILGFHIPLVNPLFVLGQAVLFTIFGFQMTLATFVFFLAVGFILAGVMMK